MSEGQATEEAGQAGAETRLRVRYAETDQMGRAHHAAYVVWFELGRTELMRTSGVSYSELEARGIQLPVTHLTVEYRDGIRYEEEAVVITRIGSVRSRAVTFQYELRRVGDTAVLARGSTALTCTDAEGATRRLPPDVHAALIRLRDAAAQDC
ncbi:MAG: thioesterase family protein [Gemmatimonadota bacterium]